MNEIIVWNRSKIELNTNKIFIQSDQSQDREAITTALSQFEGNKDSYHLPEFQTRVAEAVSGASPVALKTAEQIRQSVYGGFRFCVLHGTGFNQYRDEIRDLYILGVSSLIGEPTVTDQVSNTVLWPVRAVANPGMTNLTFSQTQDEAEYHTDTQYFDRPEPVFGLWSVHPDKNGDGLSGVIDGRELVRRIEQADGGIEIVQTLRETRFPFRVPSVFTSTASDATIEVHEAPILAVNPYIRYRRETIEKGLKATGRNLNSDERRALSRVEEEITRGDLSYNFLLQQGDVVFMSNHELLHSRTAFTDPNRFLIRVRMRESASNSRRLSNE